MIVLDTSSRACRLPCGDWPPRPTRPSRSCRCPRAGGPQARGEGVGPALHAEPPRAHGGTRCPSWKRCCGAITNLPDRPEVRAIVGPSARTFRAGADIVQHVCDVARGGPLVAKECWRLVDLAAPPGTRSARPALCHHSWATHDMANPSDL